MVWKTEGFIGYARKSLLDFEGKELSCQIVQMGVTPKGQKLSGGCVVPRKQVVKVGMQMREESHHQILTSVFIDSRPDLRACSKYSGIFVSAYQPNEYQILIVLACNIILPSLLHPSFHPSLLPFVSPFLPFFFLYASSVPFKNENADFCLGRVIA